jgi:hypothetical protein
VLPLLVFHANPLLVEQVALGDMKKTYSRTEAASKLLESRVQDLTSCPYALIIKRGFLFQKTLASGIPSVTIMPIIHLIHKLEINEEFIFLYRKYYKYLFGARILEALSERPKYKC